MVIVPSWAFGPWAWPTRVGASRCASRISRSTRAFDVRTPCHRSRAQTLRCPSPRKTAAASTARISLSNVSSLHCGFGPRRRRGRAGPAARPFVAYTVERATSHTRHTRARP